MRDFELRFSRLESYLETQQGDFVMNITQIVKSIIVNKEEYKDLEDEHQRIVLKYEYAEKVPQTVIDRAGLLYRQMKILEKKEKDSWEKLLEFSLKKKYYIEISAKKYAGIVSYFTTNEHRFYIAFNEDEGTFPEDIISARLISLKSIGIARKLGFGFQGEQDYFDAHDFDLDELDEPGQISSFLSIKEILGKRFHPDLEDRYIYIDSEEEDEPETFDYHKIERSLSYEKPMNKVGFNQDLAFILAKTLSKLKNIIMGMSIFRYGDEGDYGLVQWRGGSEEVDLIREDTFLSDYLNKVINNWQDFSVEELVEKLGKKVSIQIDRASEITKKEIRATINGLYKPPSQGAPGMAAVLEELIFAKNYSICKFMQDCTSWHQLLDDFKIEFYVKAKKAISGELREIEGDGDECAFCIYSEEDGVERKNTIPIKVFLFLFKNEINFNLRIRLFRRTPEDYVYKFMDLHLNK